MAGQRVKKPGAGGNKFAARRAGRGFPLVSDSARTPRSSGGIPLLSALTPLKGLGAETRAETNFRPPSVIATPTAESAIRRAQAARFAATVKTVFHWLDLIEAKPTTTPEEKRQLCQGCRELVAACEAEHAGLDETWAAVAEEVAYARREHAARVAGGRKRAEQRWGKKG